MDTTRLKIAHKDIEKIFNEHSLNIFKRTDIEKIIKENWDFLRLATGTTTLGFIKYLLQNTILNEHKFKFPSRTEIRYSWGEQSLYKIIETIRPNSYFTHYTALYFHNLTEQIPKTIYLNYEQAKKRTINRELEQGRIQSAFQRKVRQSSNIAEIQDYRVCLLNGKFTDQLSVIELSGDYGYDIRTTSIERTLIDCTVRPVYAGGVHEVLNGYRLAQGKVSINKLVSILKKIDYIYPYYQAIGFYLERAGNYSESAINLLRNFDFNYDFYLTHDMKEREYSREWRLYYPKGF
ncbi:MAG: hypothetical protein ABIJ45_10755 [Candidatus Zixiibacteriota bacterium]